MGREREIFFRCGFEGLLRDRAGGYFDPARAYVRAYALPTNPSRTHFCTQNVVTDKKCSVGALTLSTQTSIERGLTSHFFLSAKSPSDLLGDIASYDVRGNTERISKKFYNGISEKNLDI